MNDFDKLAASEKIEDKLKTVQNPACPSGVITALINDDTITWDSTAGQKLINAIVSHSNTTLDSLITIFSVWNSPILSSMGSESLSMHYRKLIMQNPVWKMDEIASILLDKVQKTDDGNEKCMIVGCITDSDIIDENSKMKLYEIVSKKVNSIYCLCDWALKVMEMGDRDLVKTLLNQAPKIKTELCDYWD